MSIADTITAPRDDLSRGRRQLLTLPPGHAPTRFGFRLTTANVTVSIPTRVPGSYILMAGGTVVYLGRSDRCLRTRLTTHPLRGTATHFCATVAANPRQAYLLESYWWHRYTRDGTELINRIHPAAPNLETTCPFCGFTTGQARNLGPLAATDITAAAPAVDVQDRHIHTQAAVAVKNF